MDTTKASGRPTSKPLSSLFSSAAVPEIVALLDRLGTQSIDELAARTGVSRVTASKEVRKLAELGIVNVERAGNRRHVTLATTPAARAVRNLAAIACDVPHAIAAQFAELPGVSHVAIYGSWAARHAGEPGRLPQDIDVLVIGAADRDDVYEAAENATQRIGIPVSARRVSDDDWDKRTDPFLLTIAERPLLMVAG